METVFYCQVCGVPLKQLPVTRGALVSQSGVPLPGHSFAYLYECPDCDTRVWLTESALALNADR